jgi:hypothetical protein
MRILQMNHLGHIHIWHVPDDCTSRPCSISKYNFHLDTKEADEYLQCDYDIADCLDSLTPDDRDDLNNGWDIRLAD